STPPVYPAAAKASHIQGKVVLNLNISDKGLVAAAKAISGPPFLRQAAVDAVKRWKYAPAQLDGRPVATQATVDVEFRLN
ncbi:MAG: energy transducer TonB, partial [Candidatus Acidiferrales bacterium]